MKVTLGLLAVLVSSTAIAQDDGVEPETAWLSEDAGSKRFPSGDVAGPAFKSGDQVTILFEDGDRVRVASAGKFGWVSMGVLSSQAPIDFSSFDIEAFKQSLSPQNFNLNSGASSSITLGGGLTPPGGE